MDHRRSPRSFARSMRHAPRGIAARSTALVSIVTLLFASTAIAQVEGPNLKLAGPRIAGASKSVASKPAPEIRRASPLAPTRIAAHIGVTSIPIADLPTEDVDVVEVAVPGGFAPATAVWPTEGNLHFIDEVAGIEFAALPLAGPNVSGVDFYSDGTWGVYPTAANMHIFRMAPVPGGLPTLAASVPLPDAPMRRDIDPILINHPGSPSGRAVLQATRQTITCFAIPTGAILWSTPLPSPVVEAVDPVINAANTLLFVPTDGFMTAINPITGAVLSTTALNTQLVREIDARFVLGDARCYLTALGVVFAFSGTPPGLGGTGALISSFALASLVIEGNDMEVDPTGTFGFLPTLALMYQIRLATGAVAATYNFNGAAHERNQDVVFTAPGVAPAKAVYCTEGTMWIYDVASLGAIAPVTIPLVGDLIDGVDPSFTDTPPAGNIVTVSTDGFTHVVNAVGGFQLGGSPLPTPGSLRIDVDPKPGPVPPGKILQPAIGGLWMLTGFNPSDWIVTVSNGIHVLDLSGPFVDQFVPTNLIFRGGDAQPTTLLGPAEPAYTVDEPDQDFVTKCYEYRSVLYPHPVAWVSDIYYPTWTPYGIYGPPPQVAYDLHSNFLMSLTGPVGGPANEIEVFTHSGYPIGNVPLSAPAIGGFTQDADNQFAKVRTYDHREGLIDLDYITWPNFTDVVDVADGEPPRWFPIVDRMNGWQFNVGGLTHLSIYDYLNHLRHPPILVPAPIIRQPVFDDQRKVLAAPLANQTVFFVNAHRLRLGLSAATYSSPDLGAQIAGRLTLDVYSHSTIARLADSRIVVLNNDTGAIRWASPVLPYAPISPLQTDCYNMTAKGYYRDPFAGSYYELKVNLAPILYGGGALIYWDGLPNRPYGYPHFYSRYACEFDVLPPNTILYRSLTTGTSGTVVTPYPMVGDLFVDQVNEYALVRLQGTRLFWIDLFRTVRGLSSSNKVTDLIDYNGSPIAAEEDIAFDSRDKLAVVHMADGQTAFISGTTGNEVTRTSGFPDLKRQLFSHPFRGAISFPWYDAGLGQGGHVTYDLTPLRAYIPAQVPTYSIVTTSQPPVEASDFTAPSAPLPGGITQLPPPGGTLPGMVFFGLAPGTVEPGCTVRVVNTSRYEQQSMDEPNEEQADDDGSATVAVGCSAGDAICFTAFDASGNASGQTCVTAVPVLGVGPGNEAVAFALTSRNPNRDHARFRFSLPQGAEASLSIYDVSGRRLVTLLHGHQDAGEHEVVWNFKAGHGIAAGVYFARFRSGTYESMKRVVVTP